MIRRDCSERPLIGLNQLAVDSAGPENPRIGSPTLSRATVHQR